MSFISWFCLVLFAWGLLDLLTGVLLILQGLGLGLLLCLVPRAKPPASGRVSDLFKR